MTKAEKQQGITTLDDEARAWSLKLEQGDPTARELWQWMIDLTMAANQPNYDRLGIRFDHSYGESFYAPMSEEVIQETLAKGVAYRDESGAVVVDLGDSTPTFLLQRTDSGTLYHTRDAAAIKFRVREFQPAQIIYVVDARQELNFRQLFGLARAMDYAPGVELVHIKFGTVFDQHGQPLSTRAGNMIFLDDLLNDAHRRARAIVEQSSPDLPEQEKDAVAEIVGIGAVIYNDLYQDPRRNITLDWERMLALEGNSAPYIQYMYARCQSILRKAAEQAIDDRRKTTDDHKLDSDSAIVLGPWSFVGATDAPFRTGGDQAAGQAAGGGARGRRALCAVCGGRVVLRHGAGALGLLPRLPGAQGRDAAGAARGAAAPGGRDRAGAAERPGAAGAAGAGANVTSYKL